MSDTQLSIDPGQKGNVNLIYILYLISLVVGVTSIIGVIMAYIGKSGASPALVSHYNNQINIFWKMLVFAIIGAVLSIVLVGFLVLLAAVVWFIIRVVKGMQALSADQPIEDPGSWGI
ncbi:MAG: hypothetical protein RIB03_00800 [Henriciella sp.]|uniref:DUF4870 family protein n=1 Tax=Henriciella sp. TaxID=1968823 RepID=UPI002639AAAF|nr:DUF4870 domain-containing protein [Henriciella sp.]